ncbi:2OG-Fe(II) oxygenase, partial [Nocardia gipuzkoensis]
QRYECHVDTNPIEALLYCTTHLSGEGGEVVVSNRGDVRSIEEIEADCAVIEPRAGQLLFFDAREHSHYVRQLTDPDAVRVVVAMNYYTESSPEWEVRPPDLNRHLTGAD